MQNIDTIEQCGAVVRAAENGQELERTRVLAFVEDWLKQPSMHTDNSKRQMNEIVCGLLAPRFYPQGFDFVEENRAHVLRSLTSKRVSSMVAHAERSYDFSVDSGARAAVIHDLLAAIRSVDPRLLSETERLQAVRPMVQSHDTHIAGVASLTHAGKILAEKQKANLRTLE